MQNFWIFRACVKGRREFSNAFLWKSDSLWFGENNGSYSNGRNYSQQKYCPYFTCIIIPASETSACPMMRTRILCGYHQPACKILIYFRFWSYLCFQKPRPLIYRKKRTSRGQKKPAIEFYCTHSVSRWSNYIAHSPSWRWQVITR